MLNYSRDDLPVECPGCGNVHMAEAPVSRDTYMQVIDCHCDICHDTHRVRISED
jgi:transcription elongation factor Elf1